MAARSLKIVPTEDARQCGEWECVECEYRRLEDPTVCPLLQTEPFFPPPGYAGHDRAEETDKFTADFHLYKLNGFARKITRAIADVYRYQQEGHEGDAGITIELKFPLGEVKGHIVTKLPNDIKVSLEKTSVIRENGTLRLELPKQQEMFKE